MAKSKNIPEIDRKKAEEYKVKSQDLIPTIKDVDLTKRMVTGLYNTYYYFDSDSDVLIDGSSKKSITERGPNTNVAGKIKHALFHDLTKLPGKIVVLEEREVEVNGRKVKGIYFETKMLNTPDGNDTLLKYQEGVYDNHSIGFRYMIIEFIEKGAELWNKYIDMLLNPADADKNGFMFLIKEIFLYEGSTVAFGANSLTPYLGSKSEDKEVRKRKLFDRMSAVQKQLKIGALTDEALYNLELQFSQIKQMIGELLEPEPSIKSTLIKPDIKDTPIDYQSLFKNLSILKS
jgi:hypothetical protein